MLKFRPAKGKLAVAVVIACIAGAAIDHSLFYVINQNQSVDKSQKQATDEGIEASSDQTIARYTEFLAFFTAALAGVGIFQGYLIAQQIRLARDEFNATHRPKIRVRQVFMPNVLGVDIFGADHLSHGDEFRISVTIANVGDGEAHIIDSRFRVWFYKDTARIAQFTYREPPNRIVNGIVVLGVGESRVFQVIDRAEMRPAPDRGRIVRQFMDENWKMLIFGEITYADSAGKNQRLTGFVRNWQPGGRFTRIDDPDLEYED